MVQSNEEERIRFDRCRTRLLTAGDIIAFNADILSEAILCEIQFGLSPQDALIYASVISHLRHSQPREACFLNRNSKDFDSPDIINGLSQLNCRMISSFENGQKFIQSQL